jgi:hypothetical protein
LVESQIDIDYTVQMALGETLSGDINSQQCHYRHLYLRRNLKPYLLERLRAIGR